MCLMFSKVRLVFNQCSKTSLIEQSDVSIILIVKGNKLWKRMGLLHKLIDSLYLTFAIPVLPA